MKILLNGGKDLHFHVSSSILLKNASNFYGFQTGKHSSEQTSDFQFDDGE